MSGEKKIGGIARAANLMEMFRSALMDCALVDLGYEGNRFTWSNNREAPDTVRCRLDRVCASTSWTDLFPDAYVEHLKYPGSDHIPILLHTQRPPPVLGGDRCRPWKFEVRGRYI